MRWWRKWSDQLEFQPRDERLQSPSAGGAICVSKNLIGKNLLMAAYMAASLEAEQTANGGSAHAVVHALDETCDSVPPPLEPSRRAMVLMVKMVLLVNLFAHAKGGIPVLHLDL